MAIGQTAKFMAGLLEQIRGWVPTQIDKSSQKSNANSFVGKSIERLLHNLHIRIKIMNRPQYIPPADLALQFAIVIHHQQALVLGV